MISPTIYDWPSDVIPNASLFFAGGLAVEGTFTGASVANLYPEPGGRSVLQLTFPVMKTDGAGRRASWLMSMIRNGAVFRIPIVRCPQIVTGRELGVATSYDEELLGQPWDNDMPWDNDQNWPFEPTVVAAASALDSQPKLIIDVGSFGEGLQYGHLVGVKGVAHHIDDIEYDGTEAELTLNPPLRYEVATNDIVTLRPSIVGSVREPDNFLALFDPARQIKPGPVNVLEALLP